MSGIEGPGITGGGGSAPSTEDFVTFSTEIGLPNSRVLTAGSNITVSTATPGQVIVSAAGGSPAGANTQIQYNNSGAFGASSKFTWNDAGSTLTVGTAVGAIGTGTTAGLIVSGGAPLTDTTPAQLTLGGGGGTAGAGGAIALNAGDAQTSGNGGGIQINAGDGANAGNGGNVTVAAGVKAGAGANGTIVLAAGGSNRFIVGASGELSANGSNGTSGQVLTSAGTGAAASWATAAGGVTGLANPTATIGLAAVNGSATTALRSDGAPALSQAIVPTWTGIHTWSLAEPRLLLNETDVGADLKLWDFDVNASVLTGRTRTDADGAGKNWLAVTRGTTTAISDISVGNATDNPTFTQLGTGTATFSGQISAPRVGVSGSSPPTVGMYRPAANSLGLTSNSTERLRIDANGAWLMAGTTAGNAAQVLTSNGTGTPPTWQNTGTGTAAGSTTQIQYNSSGAFAGDADLTWDDTNNILTVGSLATTGIITAPTGSTTGGGLIVRAGTGASSGTGGTLQLLGGIAPSNQAGGNVTLSAGAGNGTGAGGSVLVRGGTGGGTSGNGGLLTLQGGNGNTTNGNGADVIITGGLSANAGQPGGVQITGGNPGGSAANGGSITLTASAAGSGTGGNITLTSGNGAGTGAGGATTITSGNGVGTNQNAGTVSIATGTRTGSGTANLSLATNGSTRITIDAVGAWLVGGSAGSSTNVLTSNGSGSAPTWQAAPATAPGGSTTQVQYNNAGAFAGDAGFTFTAATDILELGESGQAGTLRAPSTTTGLGLTIAGGAATAGAGGALNLNAGAGGGATNGGGAVNINGGVGVTSGSGGNVTIAGGTSTTTAGALAGNVAINGGAAAGSGVAGMAYFTGANGIRGENQQTPSTGFTITIADRDTILVLNPAGTLATGTINMPASPLNGQIIHVTTTQTVTALTVSGNGNSISGAPSTITASLPFAMIFIATNLGSWLRFA